jgi:hypothetical protein
MNDACFSQLWRSQPASFPRKTTLGGGELALEDRAGADEDLGVAEQALSQTNTVVAIPNTAFGNRSSRRATTTASGRETTSTPVACTPRSRSSPRLPAR